MKQSLFVLPLALLFAVSNLGSAIPQPPPGHPDVSPTPPGHPDVSPSGHPDVAPPAAPAPLPETDYPEHLKSVEGVVNAVFESISGPRGQERDWDKYRTLFSPDARLFPTRLMHEQAIVGMLTVEEFVTSESKYLRGSGYFEKAVNMKVEQFGHIAHVRSIYEARRRAEDEKPYTRGIYSIQLVQTEGRWWILNMLWQPEDQLTPIPEEYLK